MLPRCPPSDGEPTATRTSRLARRAQPTRVRPARVPARSRPDRPEARRDPHPALAALRASEPVSWVPALEGWLVTRYDLAVAVMRDPATFTVDDERFSTARLVGASMLSLDGAEHDRHRAPFAAPFRPGVVREHFTAAAQAECDALLRDLAPQGAGDLRAQLAGPLAARVLTRALGLDRTQAREVRGAYEAIVAAVDALTAGQPLPEAGRRAHAALARRLTAAIDQAGEASLLGAAAGAVAAAREPGAPALTPSELAANAVVLLFGGIDTTEGMIANALALLLTDPGVGARGAGDAGAALTRSTMSAWSASSRSRCASSLPRRWSTATRPPPPSSVALPSPKGTSSTSR